jgi:hypothetical protein
VHRPSSQQRDRGARNQHGPGKRQALSMMARQGEHAPPRRRSAAVHRYYWSTKP